MSACITAFDWRKHLTVHPAADVFPLLKDIDPKAWQEFVGDIRKHGLREPLALSYPDNSLIDGRNRPDALAEIGVLSADKSGGLLYKKFIDGEWNSRSVPIGFGQCHSGDPYELVASLNVHRRHLTPEARRAAIDALLKAKPELSDRQIAGKTKSSPTTVGKRRKKGEQAGDVSKVDTRKDTAGRQQPAGKRAKPKAVTEKPVITTPVTDKDTTAKPKAPVNAKDGALERFDTYVLELIRMAKGQSPQRFAKTAVPLPRLGDLVHYLRKLIAAARKPATGDGDAS